MAASKLLLVGNGLSRGFSDDFRMPELTRRIWERLQHAGLADDLLRLVRFANTEDTALPVDQHEENFEKIAGAVDRMAGAVLAIEPLLSGTGSLVDGLRDASRELRSLYRRIAGIALLEIDEVVRTAGREDGSRDDAWAQLHDFAEALWDWHARPGGDLVVYTLNYDSLLISALLEKHPRVYDGMPYSALELPLDRWSGTLGLYPLHGALTWFQDEAGMASKRTTDEVRDDQILEAWAAGEERFGSPLVILGDAKTTAVSQPPYSHYYGQFAAEIDTCDTVVVGGYGFGDRPVNRVLAQYLAGNPRRELQVWAPGADQEEERRRCHDLLCDEVSVGRKPQLAQICGHDVYLPDAGAVRALREP